jgi:hypothetical protein
MEGVSREWYRWNAWIPRTLVLQRQEFAEDEQPRSWFTILKLLSFFSHLSCKLDWTVKAYALFTSLLAGPSSCGSH